MIINEKLLAGIDTAYRHSKIAMGKIATDKNIQGNPSLSSIVNKWVDKFKNGIENTLNNIRTKCNPNPSEKKGKGLGL